MRRQLGLSLLEVLVALTILSFSLVAIYQFQASSMRSVAGIEQRVYALELANSLLERHRFVPPGGLEVSGATEGDGGFEWVIRSRLAVEYSTTETSVYRVTVVVRSKKGQGSLAELVSYVPEVRPS
ncbi:MAG: type IV pilus modification PilV family protein [Halothiobacillaceae bacterium]